MWNNVTLQKSLWRPLSRENEPGRDNTKEAERVMIRVNEWDEVAIQPHRGHSLWIILMPNDSKAIINSNAKEKKFN